MLGLEQLIQKFWNGQTSPADNQRLYELLTKQKDDYRQELEKEFREGALHRPPGMPPEKALALLSRLHDRLGIEVPAANPTVKGFPVRRWIIASAAAACVCLLVASGFLLTRQKEFDRPALSKHSLQELPKLMQLINNSDTLMPVVLDDGSTAQLGKHSSLTWYRPFMGNRRDLSLEGTGSFKVAKDTRRPFTVYAAGTATTALGTRFWVGTQDGQHLMVRLLEGKVVVNAASGSGLTMKSIYLKPGQEFSLDKRNLQYTVRNMPGKQDHDNPAAAAPDNPQLVFNKEPLGNVFLRIGKVYHIPIRCPGKDLDSLYFTGTFLKTDNLNGILSTICNVNDLLFIRDQDTIIIKRSY